MVIDTLKGKLHTDCGYTGGGGAHGVYMSQQLDSEVERQGKANKSTTSRTALSFGGKEEELPWVGFEPTTLCILSKRMYRWRRGWGSLWSQ